jgi:hypothetical protein
VPPARPCEYERPFSTLPVGFSLFRQEDFRGVAPGLYSYWFTAVLSFKLIQHFQVFGRAGTIAQLGSAAGVFGSGSAGLG